MNKNTNKCSQRSLILLFISSFLYPVVVIFYQTLFRLLPGVISNLSPASPLFWHTHITNQLKLSVPPLTSPVYDSSPFSHNFPLAFPHPRFSNVAFAVVTLRRHFSFLLIFVVAAWRQHKLFYLVLKPPQFSTRFSTPPSLSPPLTLDPVNWQHLLLARALDIESELKVQSILPK